MNPNEASIFEKCDCNELAKPKDLSINLKTFLQKNVGQSFWNIHKTERHRILDTDITINNCWSLLSLWSNLRSSSILNSTHRLCPLPSSSISHAPQWIVTHHPFPKRKTCHAVVYHHQTDTQTLTYTHQTSLHSDYSRVESVLTSIFLLRCSLTSRSPPQSNLRHSCPLPPSLTLSLVL